MNDSKDIILDQYTLPVSQRTCIMGVLNVTPDSFSDGGMYVSPKDALSHANKMVSNGADIIDIGAESSRPGARTISSEEEMDRIMPVVQTVIKNLDVIISIDTSKSKVAREALKTGAHIINDITSLKSDDMMGSVISEFNAGVVLMHMKGNPVSMQDNPIYSDVTNEVYSFLEDAVNRALLAGIDSDKIIVDPGIGFGKSFEDNLVLLDSIQKFSDLGKAILVGTSRKSFIGKITGQEVSKREFGTAASVAVSVLNGANIVRVHEVEQMRQVIRVTEAITFQGKTCTY